MTNRLGLLLPAILGTVACSPWSSGRGAEEAFAGYIDLCGFPRSQLVEHGPDGRYFGRLHVGQRIPLELTGDTGRVQTVSWRAGNPYAPHAPVLRLTPTGRFTATLEAAEAGGDDPGDYVWVSADLTFSDGSGRGVGLEACERGSFTPVERVVVVP